MGAKSGAVLRATPVEARAVRGIMGPYTIVGTFVPEIGYAGGMPGTWVYVWSITWLVIFSLTPGTDGGSLPRVDGVTIEVARVVV